MTKHLPNLKKVLAALLAIVAVMVGHQAWAQDKTVTYTISTIVSGTHATVIFTPSGQGFGTLSTKEGSMNSTTTSPVTFELNDGLILQLNPASGSGNNLFVEDGAASIYFRGTVHFSLSNNTYYIKHVTIANANGDVLTGIPNTPGLPTTSCSLDHEVDVRLSTASSQNVYLASASNGINVGLAFGKLIVTLGESPRDYSLTYVDAVHGQNGVTNNNPTTYNVNTGTFNINAEAFSRVGYDFAGLYNNEQHTQPVSLPKTITSGYAAIDKNQTFYASWTANTYTVTLNNQSAMTPGTESVTATYDAAMPAITVPTRTGYTFGGYYTETNGGGTQYYNAEGTSAHNWDIAQATTLYAQWTANTYTVHFDANYDNNGIIISGSMSNQILTYDQGALNACSFTRIGYTFAGWNTQADGSGTTYTDQQASPNITPDNGATVTLYAQWNVINWTGGGTNENDPFVIRYASQLVKLADTVNSGTNGYQYKYFKLGNNIDMNGVAFDGIGNYEHSFNGSFNGDSKIISNVTINITGDDVGFFGDLYNATVKNLVLDGISISGIFHVGVLAGYAHYTSIDSCLVLNSSVSSTQNDYVGIIVGDQNNATLSANYYHGCTFLGTANATNVGVGDTNSYGFHGAYDVAGARSVHTLAVPVRVIVSGGETVVIDQVTYYAAGVDVTLAPDASYLTLSDVSVNGTAATPNGDGTWRFTMPAADATVTATVTMESVSYIDENGDMHYCSYYTLIGSNEGDISYGTSNTESWFVVNSNVTINNGKLTLQGSNNHLILCDGATLTITNTSGEALSANGSLTIYCQTQGTGAIVANASENGIYASSFLTINGGVVHAERQASNNNCCGIRSEDKITINGGIVTATSNNYNGYGLCAWQGIILGWTNANDRITVNSYYNQYIGIKIKDGQSLWNGSEALSGTITSLSKLNGKTLVPCTPVSRKYVRITSFDQLTDGSKVIIAARYDNVHTHGYYAMPGEAFAQPTGVAFTSETSGNDEILPATITASEDTYYWTVNMEGEYYTFKNANGPKYMTKF